MFVDTIQISNVWKKTLNGIQTIHRNVTYNTIAIEFCVSDYKLNLQIMHVGAWYCMLILNDNESKESDAM